MIVRAVLDNPSLLDKFDWFNDGKDTIAWLYSMVGHHPRALNVLEKARSLWGIHLTIPPLVPQVGRQDHSPGDDSMLEALIRYLALAGLGIQVKRTDNEVPIWVAAIHKGRLVMTVFPVANGRCLQWVTASGEGVVDVPECGEAGMVELAFRATAEVLL